MTEFLNKIKAISDSVISIGDSVTTNEQLDVILEGLPSEYESLVTLINSKAEWFEFDKVKALLLAHKQRVNKQKIVEPTTVKQALTSPQWNQAMETEWLTKLGL